MKKQIRKNPYLYDYGYHITSQSNLDNILLKGLVRNLKNEKYDEHSKQIANILYEGKIPLYFITTPSLKFLTNTFLRSFCETKTNIMMLKVNIKKFNQLPDLDYLLMDHDFLFKFIWNYNKQDERGIYNSAMDFRYKSDYFGYRKTNTFDIPPKLRKWVREYNGIIPISEFKINQKLAIDTITTTHTFCIAERIPPENIVDVYEIKK